MQERPRITLFSSLLESCVRFRFYAELLDSPARRPAAYLAVLALIAAASFVLYAYQVILPRMEAASEKFPPITIQHGKVSLPTESQFPSPSVIYADPEKILRIDLDLENQNEQNTGASEYDYTIVITKYTLILKRVGGQTHTLSLPYDLNVTFGEGSFHFFLQSWLWMILLILFFCAFLFFWVSKLAHAFLVSMTGLLFWGILRRDITYGKLFTLCVYALTPATLFSILFLWLNSQFVIPHTLVEYAWVVYFIIALEYVLGGLLSLHSSHSTKGTEGPPIERMS